MFSRTNYMTTATEQLSKQPLRMLKKMRRYHRKLRSHPLHRDAFQSLSRHIKVKQDTYYIAQAKAANTRFAKLMQHLAKK